MEVNCDICRKLILPMDNVATLTAKGADSINLASIQRGDSLVSAPGNKVHISCRRDYCNKTRIDMDRKLKCVAGNQCKPIKSLRSAFNVSNCDKKDLCLFCEQPVKFDSKHKLQSSDGMTVRTYDFQAEIKSTCIARNDDWGIAVLGRINSSVADLHASDTVYHRTCSVNFRTGKHIPKRHLPMPAKDEVTPNKRICTGRPIDEVKTEAFDKTVQSLEASDGQVTLQEIAHKMTEFLPEKIEPYSVKHIKQLLLEHFSDRALIVSSKGKPDLIMFRKTASFILKEFYELPRDTDTEEQRIRIINVVANIIKNELKSVHTPKDVYIGLDNLSVESCLDFIPSSLRILLSSLISSANSSIKIAGIGQSIVQAAKPRTVICPIPLSLGINLYNHFSSSFVVKTLSKFGYSSSYKEVSKFLRCAALHENSMPAVAHTSHSNIVHYVADNVDHNVCTIDGRGTFHGMGIISASTPMPMKQSLVIPRKEVTSQEIRKAGGILFHHYKKKQSDPLIFTELVVRLSESSLSSIDILWYCSWFFHIPHPSWSVYMQTVSKGEHLGESALFFHPMIDHSPSDVSCVFSTLLYVSKEAQKHHVTPVITFDQPLYWKAISIINSEPSHSALRDVVVLLGGFHTRMNFLGCIGYIMQNTGLEEIIEEIYASNAVKHMLSGKAVSRAIRAHILVDLALNIVLLEKAYIFDSSTDLNQYHDDLQEASVIFQGVISGDVLISENETFEALSAIHSKLRQIRHNFKESELASIWFQYMDMVSILRNFIRAERTGNWQLYLQSLMDMLPYMAASGHNLYTKSVRIHLQKMTELEECNAGVYAMFQEGLFVIRRSDHFWGGLSPDLVIEQTLMRSLKGTGGLTRGRGMDEIQRSIWTLSMPISAQLNETMQSLTGTLYTTSEQHIEQFNSRVERDNHDTEVVLSYLRPLGPFDDRNLCNIATGLTAHHTVNAHNAKSIGTAILNKMTGKDAFKYSVSRKDKVVTMASRSALKIGEDDVNIDQGLMFQRLSTVASRDPDLLEDALTYELSKFPPAIFEGVDHLRPAVKSSLASALCKMTDLSFNSTIQPACSYIIDGGWLLHQIPWQMNSTYNSICSLYSSFIRNHYENATVVFDSYCNGPSTKDLMHVKRSKGSRCPTIDFTGEMLLIKKKDEFLSNESNKQRIIHAIAQQLRDNNCRVIHAKSDADVLIVDTAVKAAELRETCVIGNDTDLLVLLLYHAKPEAHSLFLQTEKRLWNINQVKNELGVLSHTILFTHAFLGCDTISSFYGIGKRAALPLAKTDQRFQKACEIFMKEGESKEAISSAGEQAVLSIYKGRSSESLASLRHRLFMKKLCSSQTFVEARRLPPTAGALKFHSYRAYLQVMEWRGGAAGMNPEDWGWYIQNGRYMPVMTDMKPAPETLLHVVRCQCKMGCENMRCTCRRQQLQCTSACSECNGVHCTNSPSEEEENENISSEEE